MIGVRWMQVEPTTVCNLHCEFCYGRSMVAEQMDGTSFREVLDLFPDLTFLLLQGEGEPLLAPGFFDMAAEASRRRILVMTTTNGTLFTSKNIEKVLDTGIASILISIESPVPSEFRTLRGFDLAKAVKGIEALQAAKSRRGMALPAVGLAVTVLNHTKDRLPDIFDLHRALGMDGHINVRFLQKTRSYDGIYAAGMRAEILADSEVARISAQATALALQYFGGPLPPNHPFRDRLLELEAEIVGRGPGCSWLESGLYVDADGDLAPCCNIKKGLFRFGHHRTTDLSIVGRQREAMQRTLLQGSIPGVCEGCLLAERIARRQAT